MRAPARAVGRRRCAVPPSGRAGAESSAPAKKARMGPASPRIRKRANVQRCLGDGLLRGALGGLAPAPRGDSARGTRCPMRSTSPSVGASWPCRRSQARMPVAQPALRRNRRVACGGRPTSRFIRIAEPCSATAGLGKGKHPSPRFAIVRPASKSSSVGSRDANRVAQLNACERLA